MNFNHLFLKPHLENIPNELKKNPWAVWTAEPRANDPEKFEKAPRSPRTGAKIGANKPELFGTYEEAISAYESGHYTGIGVLLVKGGIVGVDIDDFKATFCEKPEIRNWVGEAVSAGAYLEYSPSKKGLRLFLKGNLPPGRRKAGKLEIYDTSRFITVTGWQIKQKRSET